MEERTLGRSGIKTPALGLGCMRLSGRGWYVGDIEVDLGYSTDDKESIRLINMAIDMGIKVFDTSMFYGAGLNEELLGKAISGRRDKVVIITKSGNIMDEKARRVVAGTVMEMDIDLKIIKQNCEDSLRRLNIDYIDIFLLGTPYKNDKIDLDKAAEVRGYMEELVEEGKIGWYGWNTDWPHQLEVFMKGKHCTCTEQQLNIFIGNEETLKLCEENNLASINRTPLAGGSIIKKDSTHSDSTRGGGEKNYRRFQAMREVITSGGRTPVQGALCWIWAKSPNTFPIPGFRTEKQVKEIIGALDFGPLTESQMAEVEEIKKKEL